MYKLQEALQVGGIKTIGFLFSLFEEDSQYVQLRRTQKMKEEAKIRNPVVKESFEIRMERRVKNWKQLQHEKKVFGDAEWALLNQMQGAVAQWESAALALQRLPVRPRSAPPLES